MSVDDLSCTSRLPGERKMSVRPIGRIEAGEVNPHYDKLIALANALDVTPGTLIAHAEQLWPTRRVSTDKSLTDR
jgi:transcriptional regulator with XRE-family HTH domain